jgi:aspartate carbamoyltransferase regulatory subunit
MKELKISAIKEGTVIDHIATENTFKVAELLNLKNRNNVITVGMNLMSKKLGKKGLIKIGGKNLTKEEVDKIALIAPEANLNIIKNYEVKKKFKLEIPKVIEKIMKCANPKCITNVEPVPTKFYVIRKNPLKVRCHYCERLIEGKDIELI